MKIRQILCLCIMIGLVPAGAFAQPSAPKLLPFQGRLTDQNGLAVSNGVRLVQFKIYDVPTGGSPVWAGELHRATINGGLVNVMLGSKTPFTGVDFDKQLYLEITADINGDNTITLGDPPMLPRQVILPVVFAKEAADSRKLAGYDWTDIFGVNNPTNPLPASKLADLPGSKIQPGSITSTQIAPQAITSAQIADGTITLDKIAPASLPISVLAKEVLDQLVPAGTIIAFGGHTNKVPDGWLHCDGRPLSSVDPRYAKLFSMIGTNWGAGVPSSTNNFNLPDLRGMFLRGVTAGRSDGFGDPDPGTERTTAIPVDVISEGRIRGGNSGNLVGSFQTNQLQVHSHQWADTTSGNSYQRQLRSWTSPLTNSSIAVILDPFASSSQVDNGTSQDEDSMQVVPPSAVLYTSPSSTIPRSGEIRPNNVCVNYIIKY